MSTTAVTFTIEKFDGEPQHLLAFKNRIDFGAAQIYSGVSKGIMSYLLPHARFVARFHMEPEILEPLPPVPNRLPGETNAAFDLRKEHREALRIRHDVFEKAKSAVFLGTVAALPQASLDKILGDDFDILTITLLELYTNLQTRIITKAETLGGYMSAMGKTFVAGDDIDSHCRCHTDGHRAHRAHRDHGEPLPPSIQINLLTDSLRPCGLFTAPLDAFARSPEAAQTFAALALVVKAEVKTTTFKETAARGYANAVRAAAEPPAAIIPTTTLDTIMTQLQALAAAQVTTRSARSARSTTRTPATAAPRQAAAPVYAYPHYCWTHGHGFHHGRVGEAKGCLHPTPNLHQPAATAANPMDGCQDNAVVRRR